MGVDEGNLQVIIDVEEVIMENCPILIPYGTYLPASIMCVFVCVCAVISFILDFVGVPVNHWCDL